MDQLHPTAGMVTLPQPACGQCGAPATCAYDYGRGTQCACPAHDPTRQPGWLTGPAPVFFQYRALAAPVAFAFPAGQLAGRVF